MQKLTNAPLLEALLDVRWAVPDPHHAGLTSNLKERLKSEFPIYTRPVIAPPIVPDIPDDATPYLVRHRFQKQENTWPLVQLGTGIFTVNSTVDYEWEEFRRIAIRSISHLFESYPARDAFQIVSLGLHYLNAVPFDFANNNILNFLETNLNSSISLPPTLLESKNITSFPKAVDLAFSFEASDPKGAMTVKFTTAIANGKPSLMFIFIFNTNFHGISFSPDEFEKWLDPAHTIIEDWFLKFAKGELLEYFSGEKHA